MAGATFGVWRSDYATYPMHPSVSYIYAFVWDPSGYIQDKELFINELSGADHVKGKLVERKLFILP